jgi:hypothetical protein
MVVSSLDAKCIGGALDPIQHQLDKAAAVRLLRKLLRRQGFVPTVIVTDNLRSTERRSAILVSRLCMSKDCTPSIARRILISRFDDANEKYKVSNQPVSSTLCFRPCCRLQHVQRATAFG